MIDLQTSKFTIGYAFFLLIAIIGFPQTASAQSYMTKSGHVEFQSSVPLHSFTGTSDKLVGRISLADSTVDFYVDVHTLETGIGKRDRDMLETLEADKHPFAEFYGKLVSDFNPNNSKPQQVTAKGTFTVHGVSKEVAIDGTLQKTSDGLKLESAWTLNMEDYNIKPPGILFYRVSKKIEVSISTTLPKTEKAR